MVIRSDIVFTSLPE